MIRWEPPTREPAWKRALGPLVGLGISAGCFAMAVVSIVGECAPGGLRMVGLRAFGVLLFGAFGTAGLGPLWESWRRWRLVRALRAHEGVCVACGASRAPGAACGACGAELPAAEALAWAFGDETLLASIALTAGGLSFVAVTVMFVGAMAEPGQRWGALVGLGLLAAFVGAIGALVAYAGVAGALARLRGPSVVRAHAMLVGAAPGVGADAAVSAELARGSVVLSGETRERVVFSATAEPALAEPALESLARLLAEEYTRATLDVRASRRRAWSAGAEKGREEALGAAYRAGAPGAARGAREGVSAVVVVASAGARETLALVLGDEEAERLCGGLEPVADERDDGEEIPVRTSVPLDALCDALASDEAVRERVLRAGAGVEPGRPEALFEVRRALRFVGAA